MADKEHRRHPPVVDMLSVPQFAKLVGLNEQIIYDYIRNHELKAYRLGKKLIRIDPAEVDNFMTEI